MPRPRLHKAKRFILQLVELRIELDAVSILEVVITGEVVSR